MSSLMHVILAVLLICGTALGNFGLGGEDCSQSAYMKCKAQLETYYVTGGMERISNNMEEFCNVLRETLECGRSKLKNCVSNVKQRESIEEIAQFDQADEMQRTLCSPEFKSKLENGKCQLPYEKAIIQCITITKNTLKDNSMVLDETSLVHKSCCVLDQYIQCAMTATKAYCTADVLETTGPLLGIMQRNPKCKDYKHGTRACENFTSKGNMNRSWTWLFFPVLTVILLQQ